MGGRRVGEWRAGGRAGGRVGLGWLLVPKLGPAARGRHAGPGVGLNIVAGRGRGGPVNRLVLLSVELVLAV